MDSNGKVLAQSVHLGLGLDLLGSKMSLNAKAGNELEVTALGVIASNKDGRRVLIPWANIKGLELERGNAKAGAGVPAPAKPLPAKPKPVAKD